MARETKQRFKYQARSAEAVKKRADQSANSFDSYIKSEYSGKEFKPTAADHLIRILPPTWPDAEHHGFDIYLHYNVGVDNSVYLCLHKMKGEHCPVCAEAKRLQDDGDDEAAGKLKAGKRVMVWMIDRNDEKAGPKFWSMPWTIDRDISKLVVDKRTGEVLPIDHPDDGYDIEFERKGTGLKTEYLGLQIARRSSDLGDDRWLDYVIDNPIPDILRFYSSEHLEAVLSGAVGSKGKEDDEDEEEDRPRPRKASRDDDDEDDRPARRSKSRSDDDDEDDEPRRGSRAREEDDDGDDEPQPRARKRIVDDADDEPTPTRRTEERTAPRGSARERARSLRDEEE